MKHNQKIGKWGEEAVAVYLIERGYEIISAQRTDALWRDRYCGKAS